MFEKIIHRVWIGDLPYKDYCKKFIESVDDCFSGCSVQWWDEEKSERFMRDNFPQLLDKVWGIDSKYKVIKSDVVRYCVLKKFGGIYTDLDFEILNPLKFRKLIGYHSFIVLTELETDLEFAKKTSKIPIRRGIPEDTVRIASYFFACEPNHIIWEYILDEMEIRLNNITSFEEDYDVMYVTGPDLISTIINRYKGQFGIKVLSVEESKCVKHHFYGQHTWKSKLKENEIGWYGKYS